MKVVAAWLFAMAFVLSACCAVWGMVQNYTNRKAEQYIKPPLPGKINTCGLAPDSNQNLGWEFRSREVA